MTREYKLDFRHQVRSFRENLVTLIWTMIGVVIGTFTIDGLGFLTIFTIGLLLWLVTSVAMAIPFHIQYLMRNWGTKLTIDSELKTIEMQENGLTFKYNFSDISTERHLLGHYRPDRRKSWQPIPFDYYGYVKIKTFNKKSFIITSLMADPFDFPLTINSTKYRFTFIEKEISDEEIRKRNEEFTEGKVNGFIDAFNSLTDDKLIYKLENKSKFEKEAIVAVERILEKRKKITTASNSYAQLPGAGSNK